MAACALAFGPLTFVRPAFSSDTLQGEPVLDDGECVEGEATEEAA